jgi:murein DD-endopeptidase MepM/ murein hydrolase activator NlpD
MTTNRGRRTHRLSSLRLRRIIPALALAVALAVALAIPGVVGCGPSPNDGSTTSSSYSSTQASGSSSSTATTVATQATGSKTTSSKTTSTKATSADTTESTKAGQGPEPSTNITGGSATASAAQEYQNLLEESKLIRTLLASSGSKGNGSTAPSLHWPVAGQHVLTSPFGLRFHPVLKKKIVHEGIDIEAASGTRVRAAAKGKIIYIGSLKEHGKTIIVDHGGGEATMYCHLSRILVSKGDAVSSGETIGMSGATGLTTGPHLHFEVRIDGVAKNPTRFLPAK